MSYSDSESCKAEFSVRIVVCDHYLTKPIPGVDVIYSEFRGADIKQVPILRIFGPTPTGRKTCLHVHGVFPYFYVPCPTQNPQPQFLYQIAASLDKALNIALKQASSTNQHVYKITLVKGLPFYGFHDKDHLFLKIFLYNPGLLKQAVELCSNGAILGQTFQPHESHLNFTLQFFIDFNLFGMSNLDLQTVKFRKSGILQTSDEVIDSLNETYLKPESICFYEADCNASHIINRQRVGKGDGMENPGLEEVWNQEKERRKRLNMSMASKSLSQGRIKCEETESHYKFEQMFLIKLSNAIELPVQIIPSKVNEVVYYPAESLEGSQLFNAAEISMHLPNDTVNESLHETLDRDHYVTLTEDNTMDDTLVDEDIALNSSFSIQYSQVLLDNDDLELVDMLNDMDDKSIDEDSILGTPADVEKDVDVVDPEYSQAFQDDTIVVDPGGPVPSSEESITSWNDSFWDGANIPQLDGTCDDEDISRKRKMRPFKLGLGKPKSKINGKIKQFSENPDFSQDLDDIEEINVSREVLDNISDLHIRKSIKSEPKSFNSNVSNKPEEESVFEELGKVKIESITDLVNKLSQSQSQNTESVHGCDLKRNFEPMPGPSKVVPINDTFYDSIESSPEDKSLGILSFYNTSKIFDISNDNPQIKLQETLNASSSKVVESTNILTPKIRPPTKNYVLSTLQKYNIPKTKYCEPYFSDHKDVGDKVELGTMLLKINSKLVKDQKPFEKVLDTMSIEEWRQLLFSERNEITEESPNPEGLKSFLAGNRHCILEPIKKPPTKLQVIQDLEKSRRSDDNETNVEDISANVIEELENSQALGLNEDGLNESLSLESNDKDKMDQSIQITMQPDGSFLCFGNSVPGQESMSESPTVDNDFLTIMLAEVLASTRGGDLHPDPAIDPIQALFLTVTNDCPPEHFLAKSTTDILVVNDTSAPRLLDRCIFKANVTYVDNELELFKNMIALIQSHDPDIMCGYEIELTSWGYILERSQALGLEIINEISRITEKNRQKRNRPENTDIEGRIIGRISFNVWRLLRHELALSSYSFENCMFVVLKERVPTYSYTQLFEWWKHESRTLRWIPVEYYLARLSGTVRMLEKLDIINRTSELARLFGLQWWEVLSRGSQFRVESLMLRAARPLNLIACSPTVKQRAAMKAPEFLPLIFEPESRFYSDPVIVLDFQSLYPSMMIAYNYCFSTCIGRVQNIQGDSVYEFGAWRLRIPKSKLEALVKKGLVHWSPAGVGFVKSSMRRGVLPALLRRILAARQAVKKSMKQQTDEGVKKAMHSRQLGLKLIANVTYGYTAANFSGRMPCVEVGDSVVAKGRETLERAIRLVREGPWNVKVVYGDTDSMFVQVPGGTRADAFEIGQQIADAVTADNPSPVALKLEKVYQPCILQTKKRYVGYMYESPAQTQPVYEAKGIETVRRDGCPLGVQMLQTALCTLFSSGDMSAVKRGVVRQLARLVRGTVAAPELAFTRELRAPPPRAAPPTHIASRLAGRAGRRVPRAGWRLAWLVVAGPPAAPLVSLARSPLELLREPGAPHVLYYVTRVLLPPLHRCLSLLGADVFKWWQELNYTRTAHERDVTGGIARYLWRARCVGCEGKLAGAGGGPAVCAGCAHEPASAAARVAARRQATSMHVAQCRQICQSCAGHSLGQCENTECPVLWRLQVAQQKHSQLNDIISHLPATFSREDLSF